MKKFVALALFAVMVLMMIPAANAAYGATPIFVSKNVYDKGELDHFDYDEGDPEYIITDALKDGVYSKVFEAKDLKISYANKYDAVGKAYYYVLIPVPTEIVTGTYKWTSVKLNGEEVLIQNSVEAWKIAECVDLNGVLYYVVGYANVAGGFNKTYTWTASNGNASTTAKYTVKLTEKVADPDPAGIAYNIAGTGEGYAISTKKGIVYVDIASDWIQNVVKEEVAIEANLTLTVNGKNPIPDGEFGYLTVKNRFADNDIKEIVKAHAFRNTDAMVLTLTLDPITTVPGTYYWEEGMLNISLDIQGGIDPDYVTGDIKVVYRIVEVGDPKGIYFVDGATKTVELGETFTLEVAGKEATLTKLIDWDVDGTIIRETEKGFVAIDEGVAYITAWYKYDVNGDKKDYTDTIKIIVAEEPATTAYYVVCRALNVRKGPSTSYGKVGLVYRNDIVDVISVDNGWAKIWFEGAERYVSYKYIDQK